MDRQKLAAEFNQNVNSLLLFALDSLKTAETRNSIRRLQGAFDIFVKHMGEEEVIRSSRPFFERHGEKLLARGTYEDLILNHDIAGECAERGIKMDDDVIYGLVGALRGLYPSYTEEERARIHSITIAMMIQSLEYALK